MHMTDVLLGVDIGTGSSKAVLTTADGHILATATRPHPHSVSMPRPGWAEVDADRVWWQDLVSLCRELPPEPASTGSPRSAPAGWVRACCCATTRTGRCGRRSSTGSTCGPATRSRS